jgi:hypothetical protein
MPFDGALAKAVLADVGPREGFEKLRRRKGDGAKAEHQTRSKDEVAG